jgi:predicted DCC family thiol-disulfide oxidoreductase YuxK
MPPESAAQATPDLVVLFDGFCNLCSAAVDFVITHDPRRRIHFCPLQSPIAHRLIGNNRSNQDDLAIVFIEDGHFYFGSSAWLRIAKHLDGPLPLLQAFAVVPRPLRELTYKLIANNRYRWFGKRDSCRLSSADTDNRFLS